MSEPRQRRDHEPGALRDLFALREMPRDLFDGQRLLRKRYFTTYIDALYLRFRAGSRPDTDLNPAPRARLLSDL